MSKIKRASSAVDQQAVFIGLQRIDGCSITQPSQAETPASCASTVVAVLHGYYQDAFWRVSLTACLLAADSCTSKGMNAMAVTWRP